jgi:non-canonical (house-cleaning) NTP pyrophosphatase
MAHIGGMLAARGDLEALGYEIETPNASEATAYDTLSASERAIRKQDLIRQHLDKINTSDAIFVFNEEKKGIPGYIGGNSLMEIAFAYAQGIEIFLLHDAHSLGCADEIYGMQPIVVDGDIHKIHAYFNSLPKTLVSSKSPVKLRAISRGMRRASIRTLVLPRPTTSAVAEQPRTIEETYAGAENRHKMLQQAALHDTPAYLATIESGNHPIHPNHNDFSSTVVILEKVGDTPKTGITVELEFPKEMTDKIPSIYPDLGILAQQEYGSTLKDPFPYFTNSKISRLSLVENAVFLVAAQLRIDQ